MTCSTKDMSKVGPARFAVYIYLIHGFLKVHWAAVHKLGSTSFQLEVVIKKQLHKVDSSLLMAGMQKLPFP